MCVRVVCVYMCLCGMCTYVSVCGECVCVACVHVSLSVCSMHVIACRSHRATCRGQPSLSVVWVLEMELNLSGLAELTVAAHQPEKLLKASSCLSVTMSAPHKHQHRKTFRSAVRLMYRKVGGPEIGSWCLGPRDRALLIPSTFPSSSRLLLTPLKLQALQPLESS